MKSRAGKRFQKKVMWIVSLNLSFCHMYELQELKPKVHVKGKLDNWVNQKVYMQLHKAVLLSYLGCFQNLILSFLPE